jgi:probable F420-dependent oxidoreductase
MVAGRRSVRRSAVQIGVVFPQTEIGADPGAVRAYVDAAADLGYAHLVAYDHVLGADAAEWGRLGPYGLADQFHEVLVLFGWLAAFSPLELATGILIGPQRQTALIAKQAAQVDLFSGGGRLRLGLGIGWNPAEYQALGVPFAQRGDRLEEQVTLLRRLWCEESVSFDGRFNTVRAAGLAPAPPTRPIPIWLAATAEPALRRVGRLADGWFPLMAPGDRLEHATGIVATAAVDAGRDPSAIGMEGQLTFKEEDRFVERAQRWRQAGATHLAVQTMGAGHRGADGHIAAISTAATALGLRSGGRPSA